MASGDVVLKATGLRVMQDDTTRDGTDVLRVSRLSHGTVVVGGGLAEFTVENDFRGAPAGVFETAFDGAKTYTITCVED